MSSGCSLYGAECRVFRVKHEIPAARGSWGQLKNVISAVLHCLVQQVLPRVHAAAFFGLSLGQHCPGFASLRFGRRSGQVPPPGSWIHPNHPTIGSTRATLRIVCCAPKDTWVRRCANSAALLRVFPRRFRVRTMQSCARRQRASVATRHQRVVTAIGLRLRHKAPLRRTTHILALLWWLPGYEQWRRGPRRVQSEKRPASQTCDEWSAEQRTGRGSSDHRPAPDPASLGLRDTVFQFPHAISNLGSPRPQRIPDPPLWDVQGRISVFSVRFPRGSVRRN